MPPSGAADQRSILRSWRCLFQLIACLACFASPGENSRMVAPCEDPYYMGRLIEPPFSEVFHLGRDRKCGQVSEHQWIYESRSKKRAKAFVNDSDPTVGLPQTRDKSLQTSQHHITWWPASVSFTHVHDGRVWEDNPPSASPFLGSYICLAWIFFVCERFSKAYRFGLYNTLWIIGTLAVIPFCAYQEDRSSSTRLLSARQNVHSGIRDHVSHFVRYSLTVWGKRRRYFCLVVCLAFLCWYFEAYWAMPTLPPSTLQTFTLWQPQGVFNYLHATRIGEASNPGPDFAISTPPSCATKTAFVRQALKQRYTYLRRPASQRLCCRRLIGRLDPSRASSSPANSVPQGNVPPSQTAKCEGNPEAP